MAAKARILAIDDQLYFRSLIEGLLSEEGYCVDSVAGESETLHYLEEHGPVDLVIMDLVMPGTDGVDFVSRLRERYPEQEIIVLTGIGDVRSVVSAMKQGAADYLLKPIDRESLLQSIDGVIEKRQLRAEHARLVGENLEFMGRLSVFERALPLFGLRQPLDVGQALLELIGIESRTRDGVVWLCETEGGPLRRAALRGNLQAEDVAEEWAVGSGTARGLEQGRPLLVSEPEPMLFIPCVRPSGLLAVVRVSAPSEGTLREEAAESCGRLAEIGALAIENAVELSHLRETSFREPRTGLPSRAFLEMVAETEIHKAHRYGRRLLCLGIELEEPLDPSRTELMQQVTESMLRTLRTTDVVAAEDLRRFWVMITDSDPLGSVVLKRRLIDRMAAVLQSAGTSGALAVGAASYPQDGATIEQLLRVAADRIATERDSVVRRLELDPHGSLAAIQLCLLEHACEMPQSFVAEAADLLIGELSARPRDRGLLFLAPGNDRNAFLAPLSALVETEAATEVFLATDGDTVPSGASITPLLLPPDVSVDTTWIVRFGEAPSYAMLAGPPRADGTRDVFHSADRGLVEHLTFRLRAEVGFGVRT